MADGIDLNGPAAEVVLAVLAWAAKMERLAINERISAARSAWKPRVATGGGRVTTRLPALVAVIVARNSPRLARGISKPKDR